MRWGGPLPFAGALRVKCEFIWWPRRLYAAWVWFEKLYVIERYKRDHRAWVRYWDGGYFEFFSQKEAENVLAKLRPLRD